LILCVFRCLNKRNISKVFLSYFEGCLLIPLLCGRKKIILDIRTGSLKGNRIGRFIENFVILLESSFFSRITVLSKGLINKLKIPKKKVVLLPLGAEATVGNRRIALEWDKIRMLYVGTLHKRNIHETVVAVGKFLESTSCDLYYDIIGFGSEEEEKKLTRYIAKLGLEANVRFHGRKDYSEVEKYLASSNIGVSYIPMTPYFEYQPPTKTFEYILSGMPCIATNTFENKQLIFAENGILCNDNPESFSEGIKEIWENRQNYLSASIVKSLEDYTWKNIVDNVLVKALIE